MLEKHKCSPNRIKMPTQDCLEAGPTTNYLQYPMMEIHCPSSIVRSIVMLTTEVKHYNTHSICYALYMYTILTTNDHKYLPVQMRTSFTKTTTKELKVLDAIFPPSFLILFFFVFLT